MRIWRRITLLCLVVAWIGTACALAPTVQPSAPQSPVESPLDTPGASPLDSPLPAASTPRLPEVAIQLDRPLREGATKVTGSAPPGVQVVLEDVTLAGAPLGRGVADGDGRFEIALFAPLEARHRVGATVELSGSPWTENDFSSDAFHGEEPLMIPQIGFYFDTSMVEQ
jgi:hypothetical protein